MRGMRVQQKVLEATRRPSGSEVKAEPPWGTTNSRTMSVMEIRGLNPSLRPAVGVEC